jgi:peptide/nickel transport system permease protein
VTGYLARRTLLAIPTLLGISLLLFVILALAPGDPFSDLATNPNVPPDVRDRLRQSLGLNDPVFVQYFHWLASLAQGSWGFSFNSRMDVLQLIGQRLPTTLLVMGSAYVIALILAFAVGVTSAVRQYSIVDNVATTMTFIGNSLPTFVTGLLFIFLFSVNLRWLPIVYRSNIQSTGVDWIFDSFRNAIMPIMVVALFEAAVLTRYVRSSMLDVIRLDYVATARAKGLRESLVIARHAVPNALIPVVTVALLQLPAVFTGSIVTEQIFSVPGIGALLINSINSKDTPVIMAVVMSYSLLVVFFNLAADVLYAVLDPRIRYA